MATPPEGNGQVLNQGWRIERIERRLDHAEVVDGERAEIIARMDEKQITLFSDVHKLTRDMAGIKKALYGLLFALSLATVAAAIDIVTRISHGGV